MRETRLIITSRCAALIRALDGFLNAHVEYNGQSMLDFVLQQNSGNWNENTDRWLGKGLSLAEWSALFLDVLDCGHGDAPSDDLPYAERLEIIRLSVEKAIPDFPMIARMWDYYWDAWYERDEIGQLRNECLRVKADTSNTLALEGLNKLLAACDEALMNKSGLLLASD
jgi:hypothetical protein